MFCGKCGAEAASGKFCIKCGAPLNLPDPVAEEKTTILDENNGFSDEPTVMAADDSTVLVNDDSTAATGDFDETVAAPVFAAQAPAENIVPPAMPILPLDPKAAKKAEKAARKANKKPMSTKKKVLVAISSVLAFIIVLSSVVVGVVAFTPKFKFMLAAYNTFRMKSFDVTMIMESYEYEEIDEEEGGYLWDYDGKDWKLESGSYSETIRQEQKFSYSFGENDESSDFYSVSEYTRKMTGSVYGKEYGTEDSNAFIDINEDTFSSRYSIECGDEILRGSLSGKDGYANSGSFIGGKKMAFYEYSREKNEDYIPMVENGRMTEEYAINTIKPIIGAHDAKEFEFGEWAGIVYDLLSLMFKEGAIEIVDTRIEDGMTKYDVRIDPYLFDKCRLDYAAENGDYKSYLKSKITYDGSNEYIELKDMKKNDDKYEESIEFTLGTKGMRLVYFLVEVEESNNNSAMIEITITNINKKKDYSSKLSDIKAIADEWKDKYTYCETAADFKAYFEEDSE